MTPERLPHEVLGLTPGASRDMIEAAYRRLIKQHHPDLGGDAEKAKAIIHAYRSLLRSGRRVPVVVSAPPADGAAKRRWPAVTLAAAASLLLWGAPWPAGQPKMERDPVRAREAVSEPSAPERPVAPLLLPKVMPDSAAVEAGVEELASFLGMKPAFALDYSRACAADLERLPGDGLLDHCLAFDLAAARAFPAEEWWREKAMTARHVRAAKVVLEDAVLAEARIREVRQQVERQLANR
jgi:hypothetical protein